jgi:hypothetical protein
MKLTLILILGAAGALSACAEPYEPPPLPVVPVAAVVPVTPASGPLADGCFHTRDITNHTIADDQTMYLNVNNRDVYRLVMSSACLAGAMPTDPIVMREPPGTPYACRPIDLDISISHSPGLTPVPCIVQSMARLTPAEVGALPPRWRP